jgi:tight adherence protein C
MDEEDDHGGRLMELLLPLIGIATALALIVYSVMSTHQERAVMRASLQQLDNYEIERVRDQELLGSLKERALAPMLKGLTGFGRRFTPSGYVDKTRAKFLATGDATAESVDRFLAIKVVTILAIPVWIFWIMHSMGIASILGKMALLVGCVVLYKAPDLVLDRKVLERQQLILRALPDVLDLLVISVEAGVGFEQALDRTVKAVPGPLSQEFNRMLGEVRAGSSRAEAMRAMEKRVSLSELRAFVMAILQADQFGVSIGHILRGQADEMRIKRRQIAQERAMKAPVKMLLPMVFCIFPSLFLVTLAPAFMNISNSAL